MRKQRQQLFAACLLVAVLLTLPWTLCQHESLERPLRDLRYRLKAQFSTPASTEIVLVGIDAQALKEITLPLSLWSEIYLEATQILVESGARVVAPDILWEFDPDSFSRLGSSQTSLRDALLEIEQQFALLVGAAPIVIGAHLDGDHLNLPRESLQAMAGDRLALLNIHEDPDGVIRRYRLSTPVSEHQETRDWPSFGGRIAELASPSLKTPPLTEGEMFWINYSGGGGALRVISLAEVLKRQGLERFRDKVVLFGPYDTRLGDLYRSPFSRNGEPDVYGMEIHAQAARTLLSGESLHPAPPVFEIFTGLALALTVGWLFARWSIPWATFATFGLGAAWFTIASWAFVKNGWWLDISGKLGLLASVAAVCYTIRYLSVERSRRLATKLFGRYAPTQVVDRLLDDPTLAQLGGQSYEVTLWFCDVNNFSTVSEKVTPERLLSLVNEVFGEIAAIIHSHGGLIRQFVGDEVMAIYGAPVPLENHALAALKTTHDVMRRLGALSAKAPPEENLFQVKIGIHSGRVVCGNVGSKDRMEYTAVGDDVNLSSRIMGLNKINNSLALASRATIELAGECPTGLSLIERGTFPVKGRVGTIDVIECLLEVPCASTPPAS